MQEEQLEIVDDQDQVIGLESRKVIHQKGLLHREIHIWFMTPKREIIFQHRAKDKDTYPDKLDATVGGHVEPGMSYDETAFKEAREETGLSLDPQNLHLIKKMRKQTVDEATGLINNTFRHQYAYFFDGAVEDLKIEEGKAIGFEAWPIDSLATLSKADQDKFILAILSPECLELFEEGQKLLGLK